MGKPTNLEHPRPTTDSPKMSSDLIWQCIKKHNSKIVTSKNASLYLSSERGNLTNQHSYKYSGLANAKSIDIQADGKRGVILATPATGSMARRRPATMYNSRKLGSNNGRKLAKSVSAQTAASYYRRDLEKAALARVTRIAKSQNPLIGGVKKAKRRR